MISLRVLSSGGALSNVEFHPTRFWRRQEDKFQPKHVHPLSPARVQYVHRVKVDVCVGQWGADEMFVVSQVPRCCHVHEAVAGTGHAVLHDA